MTVARAEVEPRPWRSGAWLAWGLAVVAHFVAALAAALFVLFGASTTCNHVANSATRAAGFRDLAIAAAVLAVSWVAAALFTRRRWCIMLTGWLIGISPVFVVAATHTQTQSWTGSFCF